MVSRCTCPECGTILRIRDRTFVGRKVHCPECKTALRVEAGAQDGQFVMRRLTAAELTRTEHDPASVSKSSLQKIAVPAAAMHLKVSSWMNSPLTAAWLLAIAVVSLFAILALTPKFRLASPRQSTAPIEIQTAAESKPISEPANVIPGELGSATEKGMDRSQQAPAATAVDQSPLVSALEPVNVDGGLPWPPIAVPTETIAEPAMPSVPPAKIVDVKSKLAFEFPLYKQATPISRRHLIEALDEQLGARIRYNAEELGHANLDKTVTFELENTTIGAVIQSVADGAGWEMEIEPSGLRLKRKTAPDKTPHKDSDK